MPSGANKRFDELGKALVNELGERLGVIVTAGNAPEWASTCEVHEVKSYENPFQRLRTTWELNQLLSTLRPATVITDFVPIPRRGLSGHYHVQLVHDLRRFVAFSSDRFEGLGRWYQKRELQSATRLLTVSHTSKREIARWCDIPDDRILVSYNGVSPVYLAPDPDVRRDIDFLYVAAFVKRKNHLNLIEAIRRLETPTNTVFVGRDQGLLDECRARVDSAKLDRQITFLGSQSEEELLALYNRAKVYVNPSLLEGFGIPLIEALGMGCVVAANDTPVFREVCGDNALYFDAKDPDSICSTMKEALRQRPPGSESASKFKWSEIASQLIQIVVPG